MARDDTYVHDEGRGRSEVHLERQRIVQRLVSAQAVLYRGQREVA